MGFLDLIPKSALLVMLAVLTAVLANVTWDSHQDAKEIARLNEEVYSLKLAAKDAKLAATNASLVNQVKLSEAKNAAKKREKQLLSDIADANAVSDGLRVSTAEARALYSVDGVAQTPRDRLADFGYELLERCESKYLSVAGRVEGYVGYIQELREAWPTSQACTASR